MLADDRPLTQRIVAPIPDRTPPRTSSLFARLVAKGVAGDASVEIQGYSRRTVRRLLRDSGLPCPRTVVSLGRCVATLERMKAGELSVERAALITGWADAATFSRRCRTLFGGTPRDLATRPLESLVHAVLVGAERSDGDMADSAMDDVTVDHYS